MPDRHARNVGDRVCSRPAPGCLRSRAQPRLLGREPHGRSVESAAWSSRCRSSGAIAASSTSRKQEIWVGAAHARRPRFQRASTAIRDTPGRPASSTPSPHDRRDPAGGSRPGSRRGTSPLRGTSGRPPGLPKDPGQSRRRPVRLRTRGRSAAALVEPTAGLGRSPGHFAYDTMTLDRTRDLGGGTRRRRLRPDRRRPRARGASPLPTRARGRRAITPAASLLRRLLLPQQRGGRRRRARRRARGAVVRCWTSTPTTATARRRSSAERPDVLVGSVHVDPGAGWFPHFLGFADETRRRHEHRRCHRDGRRAVAGGGTPSLGRMGARGGVAGPRRRARRRRRRRRSREPARGERATASAPPARCSAGSACRRSSFRRAATTSQTDRAARARGPARGSKRDERRDRDLDPSTCGASSSASSRFARIRSASASPAHPRSGRQRPSWPRRCAKLGLTGTSSRSRCR